MSQFKGDHATLWKPVQLSRELLTLGSKRHCKDSKLVISFVSTPTSNTKGFLQAGILVLSTLTPNFEEDDIGVFCDLLRIQTADCTDVKKLMKSTRPAVHIHVWGNKCVYPWINRLFNKYLSEEKRFIIISIETIIIIIIIIM